jgi:NAD(P)-dependent dehydrogenase (short-subunit alcohol dehydrogenase family)
MSETKRILITGANKGIGKALVVSLLRRTDTYILLGCRDRVRGEESLKSILFSLPGSAGRIEVVVCDISDDKSVQTAANSIITKFGNSSGVLFAIVNNAAVYSYNVLDSLNVS